MATGYKKWLKKPLPVELKWTEDGLDKHISQVIRRWEIDAEALRYANIESEAFLPRETADDEYPEALLVDQGTSSGTAFGVTLVYYRVYQVLPPDNETLVQLGKNVVTYSENGLKRVEQRFVGRSGHTLTGDVGVTTGESDSGAPGYDADIAGLYLSQNRFGERGKVSATVIKRYSEPGILSKSRQAGPQSLPGVIEHTWECFVTDPVTAGMPGIIISESESNVEGVPTLRYSSYGLPAAEADGTVILNEFESEKQIRTPGKIKIGVETNVPYLIQTPRGRGRRKVDIKIYLTATKPVVPTTIANSYADLSVGVYNRRRTKRPLGKEEGDSVEVIVYNERIYPKYQTLEGYYIESSTNNDTEFTYSYDAALDKDGDNIIGETILGFIYEKYKLTGSTTADAPPTTGLYAQEVGVVFTALDGTIYYRVEEWRV